MIDDNPMTAMDLIATPRSEAGLRVRAGLALSAVAASVAVVSAALPFSGPLALGLSMGVLGAVAAVVLAQIVQYHPHRRFGLANVVTSLRAGGVAVFVGLAAEPELLASGEAGSAAWYALAAAAGLAALDGADGLAARRGGTASAFGARFDMEVDALLILAMAALATALGKVGPWVLAIGLMRYGFVAAGWLRPALARPLPPSFRRKAVCVAQVTALAALLAPTVGPVAAQAIAVMAFAALAWSFAVDLRWLLAQPPA